MVEGIVSRPDVIDRLRVAFPTIRFFAGPALLVRRVCDGAAVLETAVERPADLSQLGVRPGPLAALVELATAVDALADLHVAEATLGLVRGRPAAVSAATMAAAGQAPPPSFEVVRTPDRDGSSTRSPSWSSPTRRPRPAPVRARPRLRTRRSLPTWTNGPEPRPARRGRGRPSMRTAARRAPSPWPPSASARATPSAWVSGTSGTPSATSAERRRSDRRIRPDTRPSGLWPRP